MNIFVTVIIYILAIIASILIDFIIANEFYRIAILKGFKYDRYFWFPFIFPIIGYIIVLALPDRGTVTTEDDGDLYDDFDKRSHKAVTEPYGERLKALKKKEGIKNFIVGVVIITILVVLFVLSDLV